MASSVSSGSSSWISRGSSYKSLRIVYIHYGAPQCLYTLWYIIKKKKKKKKKDAVSAEGSIVAVKVWIVNVLCTLFYICRQLRCHRW